MNISDRIQVIVSVFLFLIIIMGCDTTTSKLRTHKANLISGDVAFRRNAVQGLVALGADAKDATLELIQATYDEDADVRRMAIEAIGNVNPTMSIDLNEAYILILNDQDVDVRRAAVIAAGKLNNYPPNIITMLQKRLGDPDKLIRELAMSTIERIGHFSVTVLLRALKDSGEAMRLSAVLTLGRLGEDAKAAIKALKYVHENDESVYVRKAAGEAVKVIIRCIGRKPSEAKLVLDTLPDTFSDTLSDVQANVDSAEAIQTLEEALKSFSQ